MQITKNRPGTARFSRSPSKQPEPANLDGAVIAALNVILVATALVCAGLLSVPLWAALTTSWQSPSIAPAMQRWEERLIKAVDWFVRFLGSSARCPAGSPGGQLIKSSKPCLISSYFKSRSPYFEQGLAVSACRGDTLHVAVAA